MKLGSGTFLVAQWIRLYTSSAGSMGSILNAAHLGLKKLSSKFIWYFPFCIKLQIYFTNCMQGAGVELEEGLWELRRAPTGWASAPERWTEWG